MNTFAKIAINVLTQILLNKNHDNDRKEQQKRQFTRRGPTMKKYR